MTVAMLFATASCVSIVTAHEDSVPMIITQPEDPDGEIPCAVFFADNMVYAPQWRIGNLVRIEAMVINMTDFDSPEDVKESCLNVSEDFLNALDDIPDDVIGTDIEQQWVLNNHPDLLNETRMVSVNYIEVVITGPNGDYEKFVAEWDPVSKERIDGSDEVLGREVNKGGHLIYGMLWDTSHLDPEDDIGNYTVEVRLGDWYNVTHAIAHLYNPEEEGVYQNPGDPFSDLVDQEDDPQYTTYGIGIGGRGLDDSTQEDSGYAWVTLGQLIPQGPGGGNGDSDQGGDGGDGGDGNGACTSNGWGGDRSKHR
jgi:hypothetical protein